MTSSEHPQFTQMEHGFSCDRICEICAQKAERNDGRFGKCPSLGRAQGAHSGGPFGPTQGRRRPPLQEEGQRRFRMSSARDLDFWSLLAWSPAPPTLTLI